MSRWEVEDEDWDRVRDQLRAVIVQTAEEEGLIPYSDLIRSTPEIAGPQSHALAEMLGEIGEECHGQGSPLLSALVVYKDRSRHGPGPGFFEAASRLGFDVGLNATAREEFWWREVAKCHAFWAAERPAGRP